AGQLPLARHRREPERVGEILKLDRGVEAFEVTTVLRDLRRHRRRVEINGAPVREGVAGDFMAVAAELYDAAGVDAVAVFVALVAQAARAVEGPEPAELLQHRRADCCRAPGDVVKGEAHHRLLALELQGRSKQMPGEAIGEARFDVRPPTHALFPRRCRFARFLAKEAEPVPE